MNDLAFTVTRYEPGFGNCRYKVSVANFVLICKKLARGRCQYVGMENICDGYWMIESDVSHDMQALTSSTGQWWIRLAAARSAAVAAPVGMPPYMHSAFTAMYHPTV